MERGKGARAREREEEWGSGTRVRAIFNTIREAERRKRVQVPGIEEDIQ